MSSEIENYAINIRAVAALMGLSRSSIYDFLNPKSGRYKPDFPRSFRYSNGDRGAVRWNKAEVLAWIDRRAAANCGGGSIARQSSGQGDQFSVFRVDRTSRACESSAGA
ncbi:helix-turn-helix transcriptional regulator [Acidovorax sp.]|uniref:helix-turn-helix transcriptional regulator n=1 Tax=Acidovorax sp. TaxID=1872122 RepID=UPI004037DCB6